jgi:glycosyltransferase involved in cell wall biosynthesis
MGPRDEARDDGITSVTVDIAMPTYNCAPWLAQTIDSILAQDITSWRLIVRDDRSTDDTSRRLADWQTKLGERMMILPDSGARNLGVTGNYNAVLTAATTPWVMSADPDDVWLPGKILRTWRAMRRAEAEFGVTTPTAVCTDAAVIDGTGQPITPSYWRWSRIGLTRIGETPRVAMESAALGSTMMINRALLETALPIPAAAPYQDWWLALVAAAFGRLIPLPERTILYRRHGSNETADPYSSALGSALRRAVTAPGAARQRLRKIVAQSSSIAGAFVERYRSRLGPRDAAALECLARLFSLGPLERRAALLQHGLWFSSRFKNLGLLALV